MHQFLVFDHKSFFTKRLLALGACEIIGWINVDVSFLVTIEVAFRAQHLSADPANEFLSRPKINFH